MIVIRRLAASHYKGLIDVSLRLPERGSVLIEGRNEAGKSTLFDAVHFGLYGRPLVGDQPDAIHYGADQAVVELDLQVDNTELKLRRALRQTAKTLRVEAELEVRRRTGEDPSDVEVEHVKGAAAVNTRVQLELGGLTAEALLNSCLVAQKQLGRLEELARGSREAALTVLLNLGKLSDVHQRLRVKPEDEEQLRRARARVELARVTEQLVGLETRRATLERTRRLADLRAVLDELGLVTAAQSELTAESEQLAEQLGEARAALAEVDRARGELAAWQRLTELAARLDALRAERADAEARLAALGEATRALPERRATLTEAQATRAAAQALLDTRRLGESLAREGERIVARMAERAELASRCGRLDEELTRLRTQHRGVQAQLQQLAPLTTEREASRARQRELAALQREVSAALQERAVVDDLAVRVKDVDVAEDRQSLLVRLLVDHPVTGALAVHLRLWQGGGELVDVRGNRTAATRGERCLERAIALKLDVTAVDELPQVIATALQKEGERQAELSTAAGRHEGLQGQLALLERNGKERKRELEECRLSLERDSDETLAAQRADVEQRAAETEHEAARLLAELEERLGDAALDDAREAAQRRVDVLSAEVAVLERQVADADALGERAAALARALDEAAAQLAEAERAAGGTADQAPSRSAALAQQLEQLGEATLRAREQELQRAAGAVEARLHRSEEDARTLATAGVRLTTELGQSIDPAQLAESAPAAFPELAGALPSRGEIEAQLSALAQERGAAERGAADARTTLGSEDAQPLAETEAALRELEEQHAARRRGQEIVSLTRQRMINKVLPDTINNMCVLLPQLTTDRYRYAELTPDYKLQVWDERAKAYVEKSLFSGGTQDQFSLALRLGFALAALPRELGTSPGFLFLDEPLSSFDRDRSEALVSLLTRGQVSTFFRQVLLISHSQAFDPTLFNHHVLMEHGRVAESTLPAAPHTAP